MNSPRSKSLAAALLFCLALSPWSTHAATQTVLASGLSQPTRAVLTPRGNLLVSGKALTPHSGYVAWVERTTGQHRPLLAGLPSAIAAVGEPSGPNGLLLEDDGFSCRFGAERWAHFLSKRDHPGPGRRDRNPTLFLLIGPGDVTKAGPTPGTEVPNPQGPSSPIFSSLLLVRFDRDVDALASGFALTLAHQFALADGAPVTLTNTEGARASLEVLADFRDYLPDPRMIVRISNPFALTRVGQNIYVADASANTVIEVDADSGRARTLVRFAPLPNPLPFGPPMIDAVPDGIAAHGDKLLVTLLSGFPFPAQSARVMAVDRRTGAAQPFITNLTSAIDVLPVAGRRWSTQFLVLQYSTNQLASEPGVLLRFPAPDAAPEIVADTLTSPTSVIRDPRTGELFVTEIFPGRIIRIQE